MERDSNLIQLEMRRSHYNRPSDTQRSIREYLENLEEIDKFLSTYDTYGGEENQLLTQVASNLQRATWHAHAHIHACTQVNKSGKKNLRSHCMALVQEQTDEWMNWETQK